MTNDKNPPPSVDADEAIKKILVPSDYKNKRIREFATSIFKAGQASERAKVQLIIDAASKALNLMLEPINTGNICEARIELEKAFAAYESEGERE